MAGESALVGRDSELEALIGLVSRARSGRSDAVFIHGEPGVGKSALLGALQRSVQGVVQLRMTGHEAEADLGFAGLSQLVRGHLGLIERLPSPQREAIRTALAMGPPVLPDRFILGTSLLNLLGIIAENGPAVVLVDDAQWLDRATVQALAFACHRLGAEGVAVVIAGRGMETDAFAAIRRLDLGGLDRSNTDRLVTSLVSCRPLPAVVDRIHDATQGNPLAVIEVVNAVSAEHLRGQRPLPDPLPVGDRLQLAYRKRLRRLPAATREALLMLAADPGRAGATPARVLDLSGGDVPVLEPAERAGLVTMEGGRVAFRHPIVRAAVYHDAAPAERRAVHLLLAAVERDADLVAWHRAAAAIGHDEVAADLLAEAAARAHRRGAHVEAGRAYLRAADLTRDSRTAMRRRVQAAEEQQLGGDPDAAATILDGVVEAGDDAVMTAAIEHLRATIDMFRGNPMRLRNLLIAKAEPLEAGHPDQAARLYIDAILPCIAGGSSEAALVPARRAARLMGSAHPVTELAMGVATTEEGLELAARPHLMRAAHMFESVDPLDDHLLVAFTALALGVHRRLGPAHALIDRLLGAAAAANMPGLLPFALAVSSMLHYWSGSWSRATAAGSEAVDLSAVTGHAVGPSHVFAMFVAAGRGREDECRTLADRAAEAIERTGDVGLRCWRHAALGRLELSLDRPAAAAAELEAALAARPPGGVPDWTADLIEAYDRTGQPSRADELRGRLSQWAERNQDPLGRGLVAQALLRRVNGDDLDEQYQRGVDELERASDHVAGARLALEYGERLRREKRLTEARRPLGEAFGRFTRLGAGPWTARALRELRACGGAPPPTKPDSLAALTPQELRVAFEVARGATNREVAGRLVLSAKTVAFHLNNVYRKLGIRSRVELARVVAGTQLEGAAAPVGPAVSAG